MHNESVFKLVSASAHILTLQLDVESYVLSPQHGPFKPIIFLHVSFVPVYAEQFYNELTHFNPLYLHPTKY